MSKEVKKWLEERGSVLTIESIKGIGCCVGSQVEVVTWLEPPKNHNGYLEEYVDGVHFFIEKGLTFKKGIVKISLSRFLFTKQITISGLERF